MRKVELMLYIQIMFYHISLNRGEKKFKTIERVIVYIVVTATATRKTSRDGIIILYAMGRQFHRSLRSYKSGQHSL